MTGEIKLFNTANIPLFTTILVDEYVTDILEYTIENEPEDTSPTRDDIVMKKSTTVDARTTSSGTQLITSINVDYAEERNVENNKNPHKKGYIEKSQRYSEDIILDKIDWTELVSTKK